MDWEAVIFDFDGVIADTIFVKSRAFRSLFSRFGRDIEERAHDYYLSTGGISRYEKLKYLYKTFFNKTLSEEELKNLGNAFSRAVVGKVVAAREMPGARDTLANLNEKGIPAFLSSGTPHEELRSIIHKRGIAHYFKEIHGSPPGKTEITQDILFRYGFSPEKCLFVGDAMADYHAAQENNMQFLGIVPKGTPSLFPKDTWIKECINLEPPEK